MSLLILAGVVVVGIVSGAVAICQYSMNRRRLLKRVDECRWYGQGVRL